MKVQECGLEIGHVFITYWALCSFTSTKKKEEKRGEGGERATVAQLPMTSKGSQPSKHGY